MKSLIVTGDDFGRSAAVNEAIERSHEAGFLTQASLMVNERAADEAVRIARRHPRLCVGLHLTLCAGRAAQPSALTHAHGDFPASPALAGFRYFFSRKLHTPLAEEIAAQFAQFRALGFPPTYWDGHAHLHLHPSIVRLTLPVASEHLFRATRLVREPGPPSPLSLVFDALSARAIPQLRAHGVSFTDRVFGLRDTGRMRTATIAGILENLPDGLSELYFHPGAEPAPIDFAALIPLLARHAIQLTPSPANVS